MKNFLKPIKTFHLLSLFFLYAIFTGADCSLKALIGKKSIALEITDVVNIMQKVINWFVAAMAGTAFIFFIIGGYQYMTSAGNQEATQKAKATLTWAIIGFILVIASFAIIKLLVEMISPATTTSPTP